jgi:hypothetical protein
VYRTTSKNLTGQTLFRLVYVQESVMPMEFIVSSMDIVILIDIRDSSTVEKRLSEIVELEEECFVTRFHQQLINHTRNPCMTDTLNKIISR